MFNKTLSDGTIIDITSSDCHTGPGRTGQRVGSGNWYRINNGQWFLSQHRHMYDLREWIDLSENLADFMEGENISEQEG